MFRKPVNQTGSAPATTRLAVPGHWGYGNVLFLWSVNVYLSVSVLAVPVTMDNTLHLTSSLIGWAHTQNDPCLLMGYTNAVSHYNHVIMSAMGTQITGLLDCLFNRLLRRSSKKASSSASLAFVRGIHPWQVDSPHKGPVTWTMFPFDDVIMSHEVWA